MNKVYACVDGHAHAAAVLDWAAWSAGRLNLPLELLHVLERPPGAGQVQDYSGAIGLGAQEDLLNRLSELDAARAQLAQEAGRQLLSAARAHLRAAGLAECDARLRHGELVEAVQELQADARLFVLGEHYRDPRPERRHLDHHLERVLRAVARPVLVSTAPVFAPPQRVALAWDGSATADRMVERVAASPLLRGLSLELVRVAGDTPALRQALERPQRLLTEAGFDVTVAVLPGVAEEVLPAHLVASGASLLVMGAYGHSRIRQLILGSTTTALLRTSTVPVLVMR